MALISCPECGKQISDSTSSCPHCGYRISSGGNPAAPAPTKISDISVSYPAGIGMIAGGIILLPVSFFGLFVFVIPGRIALFLPFAIIVAGVQKISGTRSICCPYYGKPAEVGKNFDKYKCPSCKKRSVRSNDYLNPMISMGINFQYKYS